MKKIIPLFLVTVFTFTAQANAQSIFNNNTANKVVGNCTIRADYNVILKTYTNNEICDPRVYTITVNGNQSTTPTYYNMSYYSTPSYYYSSPVYYSTPSYSYPSYSYTSPANGYYAGGNYGYNAFGNGNYLDNSGYYQAVETYTPSIYGQDFYNQQGVYGYSGYGNGGYYEESYYEEGYGSGGLNSLGYDQNGYYYGEGAYYDQGVYDQYGQINNTGCNYDNSGQMYCF